MSSPETRPVSHDSRSAQDSRDEILKAAMHLFANRGLNEQVLKIYSGYRGMLVELIARAQQKGLCALRFTPEAAAGFLLSALNGILIEHLFVANNPLDSDEAVAMVSEWLFGQETPSGGGKAVA